MGSLMAGWDSPVLGDDKKGISMQIKAIYRNLLVRPCIFIHTYDSLCERSSRAAKPVADKGGGGCVLEAAAPEVIVIIGGGRRRPRLAPRLPRRQGTSFLISSIVLCIRIHA